MRRATVRIEEIAAGGDGVANVDGARIFTPLTTQGDLVEIDYAGARGRVVNILEPGPARIEPPCKHYGACGGCALQHLNAEFYSGWKRARIVDALSHAGLGGVRVNETIETPAASRRRATFAVRRNGGGVLVGFNARRSSEISEIDGCLILHPEILSRHSDLAELAKHIDAGTFDLAATLCKNGLDLNLVGDIAAPSMAATNALSPLMRAAGAIRLSINGEALIALGEPVVSFDGISISPPPGAFLQASREGEAALTKLVIDAAKGAKKIVDLFSGCGTFALPLAKAATVSAFDSDEAAIAALDRGARLAQGAGLNPLRAGRRDLFERPLSAKELQQFDAIVFDPPRAGAKFQAENIAASGVPKIIAVSCNPATFARDAALIVNAGYALQEVTPVDQFVYSSHVELVGVFRKAK
ncbi:MAG: class I SAM-dependent RNA methyltransferase [Parvularculaceae bacterium]